MTWVGLGASKLLTGKCGSSGRLPFVYCHCGQSRQSLGAYSHHDHSVSPWPRSHIPTFRASSFRALLRLTERDTLPVKKFEGELLELLRRKSVLVEHAGPGPCPDEKSGEEGFNDGFDVVVGVICQPAITAFGSRNSHRKPMTCLSMTRSTKGPVMA